MNKGMIRATLAIFAPLLLTPAVAWSADIWKVVDEDGNVTYTDQPPSDGSKPMDLPELSVIETVAPPSSDGQSAAAEEEAREPTMRELRQMYRDFKITQPKNEETFWGAANTVVVSWSSELPPAEGMTAQLIVDGASQEVPPSGSATLTLDRGEHRVHAELLDARKRRIVATPLVRFFIKQNSANFGGA